MVKLVFGHYIADIPGTLNRAEDFPDHVKATVIYEDRKLGSYSLNKVYL